MPIDNDVLYVRTGKLVLFRRLIIFHMYFLGRPAAMSPSDLSTFVGHAVEPILCSPLNKLP